MNFLPHFLCNKNIFVEGFIFCKAILFPLSFFVSFTSENWSIGLISLIKIFEVWCQTCSNFGKFEIWDDPFLRIIFRRPFIIIVSFVTAVEKSLLKYRIIELENSNILNLEWRSEINKCFSARKPWKTKATYLCLSFETKFLSMAFALYDRSKKLKIHKVN